MNWLMQGGDVSESRTVETPADGAESTPEVTVVMPIRNEAGTIERALDAVLAQAVDVPFEVVVAEGCSTDGTRAILVRRAAAQSRLRIVENLNGGTPQALNSGLRAARGRYIVRVDGHSTVSPGYVQTVVDHLRSGRCEGVGGWKRAVGFGSFGRAVAAAHGSRFGIGDSKHHFRGGVEYVDHVPFGAYLTELARRIGGWDEELVRNQDYDFDVRYAKAGGRLLLDPSLVVDWRVADGPKRLARQYFQYGFWKCRVFLRHPEAFHLRWLAPPALVSMLAAGAIFSWNEGGRTLLAVVGGSYILFLAAGALALGARVGFRLAPYTAVALATMHLAWGSGFALSAVKAALHALRRRARVERRGASG